MSFPSFLLKQLFSINLSNVHILLLSVFQGVEVFSTDGSHMYLIFNSPKERDLFYEQIVQQPGQ